MNRVILPQGNPLFPQHDSKKMIQKCLNCTRKECYGTCEDVYLREEKSAEREARKKQQEIEKAKRAEERERLAEERRKLAEEKKRNPSRTKPTAFTVRSRRKAPQPAEKITHAEAVEKALYNHRLYTYEGEKRTISEWAKKYGLTNEELRARLKRYKSMHAALRSIKELQKYPRYIAFGRSLTMREWASLCGKCKNTLHERLKKGQSPEEAFREAKEKIKKEQDHEHHQSVV